MKKYLNTTALLMLISLECHSQALRYGELVQLIKSKNKLVAAERAQVKSHEVRTGLLGRSFLPHLFAQAGSETFKVGSQDTKNNPFWSLDGSINLWKGGADSLENDNRELLKKSSEVELDLTERESLLSARKLFWEIITIKEHIAIQENSIKENEKHYKMAKRRISAGLATKADPLEFELQKTLLEQDFKKLTLNLDEAKNRLAVLISDPNHEALDVGEKYAHPRNSELQDVVVNFDQVPQTLLQSLNKDIRENEAQRKSRSWWPQLDLYSQYAQYTEREQTVAETSERREFSVGLRLKMNLFDGLESRREAQAQEALALSAKYKLEHLSEGVRATVHELKHDLTLLHDLLHDAEESAKKSREFLKLTIEEYSRGVKNGPDVLEASIKTMDFEKRLYSLFQDYYTTRSELLALAGK